MFGSPTPILRSFEEARAKAFYIDFLGFELLFEHRFEEGLPQTQIAERVGLSQMHVSRLIRRSLATMREELG